MKKMSRSEAKSLFCILALILIGLEAYPQDLTKSLSDAISQAAEQVEPPKAAETPKSLKMPFRLGEILYAELAKYDEDRIIIMNPEAIKQRTGVAALVFKLDDGRSIGLCDYVLEDDKGNSYPSVAFRMDDAVFDGGAWETVKQGEHRFSLLFFVDYPDDGANRKYKLKYVLLKDIKDDHEIEFRNIGDNNFTLPSAIDETAKETPPAPALDINAPKPDAPAAPQPQNPAPAPANTPAPQEAPAPADAPPPGAAK